MERHARIILVSTFIVISVIALAVFYRWIQGPDPEKLGVDTAILFDGSVSGLSIGSEVRYLGVPVGRVSRISLSREFPGRVEVVFGSRESLPPPQRMVALLQAQGITGLSIIELRERSEEAPGFDVPDGMIPGYPSLLAQLAGSAGRITSSVEATLGRINGVLSEDTAEDLSVSIRQLRSLSGNLAVASENVDELLASAARIGSELEETLPEFRSTARRLNRDVLPAVTEAGRSLQQATDSVNMALGDNREAVQQLLSKDLPTLIGITDQLAVTLRELDRLLGNVNEQPGALLYGEQVREVEIPND
jgi:phospholipid/cholesterol/gamma-HCH transport system substrate-binding protein